MFMACVFLSINFPIHPSPLLTSTAGDASDPVYTYEFRGWMFLVALIKEFKSFAFFSWLSYCSTHSRLLCFDVQMLRRIESANLCYLYLNQDKKYCVLPDSKKGTVSHWRSPQQINFNTIIVLFFIQSTGTVSILMYIAKTIIQTAFSLSMFLFINIFSASGFWMSDPTGQSDTVVFVVAVYFCISVKPCLAHLSSHIMPKHRGFQWVVYLTYLRSFKGISCNWLEVSWMFTCIKHVLKVTDRKVKRCK